MLLLLLARITTAIASYHRIYFSLSSHICHHCPIFYLGKCRCAEAGAAGCCCCIRSWERIDRKLRNYGRMNVNIGNNIRFDT